MPSYKNLGDVFQGGATTSQHVEAADDEHFKNSTFALKRTRSLGLLDDYIIPSDSKVKEEFVTDETLNKINNSRPGSSNASSENLAATMKPQGHVNSSHLKHRLSKLNTSPAAVPIQTQPSKSANAQKYSLIYNSDSSDSENDSNDQTNDNDDNDDDDKNNTIQNRDDQLQRSNNDKTDEMMRTRAASASPSSATAPLLSPEIIPHDDNDLLYEPQRHVDYLSHDWKESDISKSWRYIVLRRKDVANSARLENASWRTWAQAKNHLRTVSPESVNWLKESDVTWLYGPLYKEPSTSGDFLMEDSLKSHSRDELDNSTQKNNSSPSVYRYKSPSHDDEGNKNGPKPILKKRSAAEMMLSQAEFMKLSLLQNHQKQWNHHGGSPILEAINNNSNSPPAHGGRHIHDRNLSPVSLNSPSHDLIAQSTDSVTTSTQSATGSSSSISKKDRHIHFNDTVEQCIAVNIPTDDEGNFNDADGEDAEDSSDSDSSDDEGGFCLKVRSPSSAFLFEQGFPGFQVQPPSKLSSGERKSPVGTSALAEKPKYQIIAALPSTNLNYNSSDDDSHEPDSAYTDDDHGREEKIYTSVPFYDNRVSHNVHTSRNYDYHYNYDYNSIYPSSNSVTGDSIMDDKKNKELEVYDIPENLDIGSIIPVGDVSEVEGDPSSTAPLARTSSGYSIKEQQPLPPYQSNDLASGKTAGSPEQEIPPSINQRLQRISSREDQQAYENSKSISGNAAAAATGGAAAITAKTKDLANAFLGNWKK